MPTSMGRPSRRQHAVKKTHCQQERSCPPNVCGRTGSMLHKTICYLGREIYNACNLAQNKQIEASFGFVTQTNNLFSLIMA